MNNSTYKNEMPDLNLSYAELKEIIQHLISNFSSGFDFTGFHRHLAEHLSKNSLGFKTEPNTYYSGDLQQKDINLVREIIWDLIIDRYLTLGGNGHDQWPSLTITTRGKEFFGSLS